MPFKKIIEDAKLIVSSQPLPENLDQINPECFPKVSIDRRPMIKQKTDEQIQEIAREILGRELTADELIEIRGMCKPGMTCPVAPRIKRLQAH